MAICGCNSLCGAGNNAFALLAADFFKVVELSLQIGNREENLQQWVCFWRFLLITEAVDRPFFTCLPPSLVFSASMPGERCKNTSNGKSRQKQKRLLIQTLWIIFLCGNSAPSEICTSGGVILNLADNQMNSKWILTLSVDCYSTIGVISEGQSNC